MKLSKWQRTHQYKESKEVLGGPLSYSIVLGQDIFSGSVLLVSLNKDRSNLKVQTLIQHHHVPSFQIRGLIL